MLKTIGITAVALLFSAATAVAQINIPPEIGQPPVTQPPPPPPPEPDPVVEPEPVPEPDPVVEPEPAPAPEAGKDCKHRRKARCDDEARRQAIRDRIELHKQRMRERHARLKAALEAAKKRHCRK